jgi:glycosyltransferase involved in cell wall biosynthesis
VLKLLLIAPFCDGEDVGEAWVGHQWVRHLAARHKVTLLTYYKRDRTRPSQQLSSARIIEWAEPTMLGRHERLNSMLKPGYLPFYRHARNWIRAALERGERFDLAHQPIPVAMRYPCPATGLGIPFVMGPVGGSLPSPPDFERGEDTAPWYIALRHLDHFRFRHDPFLRRTYEQADCVIGIAPYVKELLEGVKLRKFDIMSETGIERLPEPLDRLGQTSDVKLLFVGRLIRTKGARDLIRALGYVRDLPVDLDIVGDGFDRVACETLTAELRLTERVHFHGRLPRDQVNRFYQAADIFVFPSYREPGGNVAFEAMSYGLPLIVSDIGGPGNVVDDTCGIRVHPVTPVQYAEEIAAAIAKLVARPKLRRTLGEGARRRVADIALWDNKVRDLEQIYAEVLQRSI